MSADLHIHVLDGECTEHDIAVFHNHSLGSKHFRKYEEPEYASPEYDRLWKVVGDTPNVWVGEVSWLKAALFEDAERFVPSTVAEIASLIGEDLPVIDDAVIAKIRAAFKLKNTTNYRLAKAKDVSAFLRKHKGKRAFAVSW